MTKIRKYFGTDGIRGPYGHTPIHSDFFLQLGRALGQVLPGSHKRVVIGLDTRHSSQVLAKSLACGLMTQGISVADIGIAPTPAVAYLSKHLDFDLGCMISASHNPFADNGIKLFNHEGLKLGDELEWKIEQAIEAPIKDELVSVGEYQSTPKLAQFYIDFCQQQFIENPKKELTVVLDCANGAYSNMAPKTLEQLGMKVFSIHDEPNGFNINQDCGALHLESLQAEVLAKNADLGIAFDGDGDRLVLVDDLGQVVDGDDIIYILAKAYRDNHQSLGGVVGTSMTNMGLELAFKDMNVPFQRAKVGDRYVIEALQEKSWTIGGETSGHVICMDKTTTGDGLLAALGIIRYMLESQQSLSTLKQGWSRFSQTLLNVPSNQKDVCANPEVQLAVQKVSDNLKGRGRVVLRASGTEPVVRIMVEGQESLEVKKLASYIKDVLEAQ